MNGPRSVEPFLARSRKRELRRAIKATIAALNPCQRRAEEARLAAQCPGLPGFAGARTVLLYVSALPDEIPTNELIARALELGKAVCCPRVERTGRRLHLHRVVDPVNDLESGALGIPEPGPGLPELAPEAIDWALVPGLAFDERGYRLGRGGGYYDRLLPLLRADSICWAVALECQVVPELHVDPHDAPLNGIATATRTIRGCRPGHLAAT